MDAFGSFQISMANRNTRARLEKNVEFPRIVSPGKLQDNQKDLTNVIRMYQQFADVDRRKDR